MNVSLALSLDEGRLLAQQLARHIESVDRELIGTSRRELQHQLASEADKLGAIATRLTGLLAEEQR